MRKITFLLCCLTVFLGFAQTDIETFEGTVPPLAIANATTGTAANVVPNPDSSMGSGNESANVLEFITGNAGVPWQQAELTLQGDYLDLTPGTSNTMTIDVYSTVAFDVLVRVTDGVVSSTNGTAVADSAADAIHGGTGWETLTFDFNDPQDGQGTGQGIYGRIFIFNLWDANDAGSGAGSWSCGNTGDCPATTRYYDNINGVASARPETCNDGILNNGETQIDCGGPNCSACPNPPSAAPTTPPNRAAADVISVYSDAYTDEATDQRQPFGDAVVTDLDLSGNSVISATTPLPGAGFQYQYFSTTPQFLDLSGMTHMHVDFYFEGSPSTAGTFFTVIAQYNGGSNAIQYNEDVTVLAPNTWHEIDVTFDSFASGAPRDQIGQVIVQINGPDIYGPFYVDNIYFHNNMVLSTDDFNKTSFKAYPNPTQDTWLLSGNSQIESVRVLDILGKEVMMLSPNNDEATIDGSGLKSGIYFAQIKTLTGIDSIKLIKQ